MTQEKQNSIRILQNKPVKKNLSASSIFLLGFFIGLIVSAIFFLIFFNSNHTVEMESNTAEILQQNELEKNNHVSSESNHEHSENEDENTDSYKQHVNEKDLKNIFRHENKVQAPKNPSKSPFEQMNESEKKNSLKITSSSTQPPLAKPITKETALESKIKKPITQKIEEKEISAADKKLEDVSPEGSVKVLIDRRAIENKP